MLIDTIQLVEGAVIVNATVPSGVAFPGSPGVGELFYLTSGTVGMYVYGSGAWSPVDSSMSVLKAGDAMTGDLHIGTSGSAGSLTISDAGGNGANLKLIGNGSTTPSKYIRAFNGKLSVVSSGYTAEILSLDDAGNLTVPGSITASGTASAVNWLQAGSGATVRTTADKLRESVSAFDYFTSAQIADVQGNVGALDVTAALQTAVTSNPGRCILCPAGRYSLTSLNVTTALTLRGDGNGGTVFTTSSATADVLNITGSQVTVEGIGFTSSVVRTAGALVRFGSACTRVTLRDFYITNYYQGVRIEAAAACRVQNGYMFGPATAPGAGSAGILIDGGNDTYISQVTMDAPAAQMPVAGIQVSQTGCVNITDCDIIHHGQDLLINPGSGQSVASVYAENSYFDTANRGILVDPSGTGVVIRCRFVGCWASSHVNDGVLINAGGTGARSGFEFIGHHGFLNGGSGILVQGGGTPATDVQVTGGSFAQNAGSGLAFGAGVRNFSVSGTNSGAYEGLTGNGQWGLVVAAGSSDGYRIVGCGFFGNGAGSVSDSGTGQNKFLVGNIPYASLSLSSTNSTGTLVVSDAGSSGANIKLAGNGATTPNKYVRSHDGKLSVVNSAYTSEILSLDDAGNLTVPGSITASGTASAVNWLQAGSAVVRTAADKLRESVSVLDFGATGNGMTDDTAAFNAAIATVAAVGGLVRVPTPSSAYKITGAITLPSNVWLVGDGNSTLMIAGSGFNAINVAGDYCGVEGLNFQSASPRTSGIAVAILGANRDNFVRRCRFNNQFYGITVGAAVITWIEDCEITNTAPTNGIGIDIQSGNDTYVRGVVMDGNPAAQPLCGVRILNSQGVWITDSDFIHQGIGVSISPSSSQATWLFFSNVACDTCVGDGWSISATGTGVVRGVFMTGCWSSTCARGVLIQQTAGASIDGVFMVNHHAVNNLQQGILVLAGPTGVYVSDSVVSGNSGSSAGTYAGIDFQANCTYFGVTNTRAGTAMGFGNNQSYGILVNAGASDFYTIAGNNVAGNVTAGLVDNGTGANKHVFGNLGATVSVTSLGAAGSLTLTSTNSTRSLVITDTGTSGANIKLAGNGSTTPNKYVRVIDGKLSVVNSAYTSEILSLDDAGNLTVPGNLTVSGTASAVNWLQTGTGATVRTASSKLQDTVSVKDFGAVGNGVTDDTAAILAACVSLGAVGGTVIVPPHMRCLVDSSFALPANACLRGSANFVGTPGTNSSTPYGSLGGLVLNEASTLTLGPGAGLVGLLICRKGMTFPAADSSAFAGTAVTVGGDDALVERCMILGFNKAVLCIGYQRVRIDYLQHDNNNGVEVANCLDVPYITRCHAWPFATIAAAGAHASLERSGKAYYVHDSGGFPVDDAKITDCFSYGYAVGYQIENVNGTTLLSCTADNSFSGSPQNVGSVGFYVLGTSQETRLVGPQASAQDKAGIWVNTANGKVTQITQGDVWSTGSTGAAIIVDGGDVKIGAVLRSHTNGVYVNSAASIIEILPETRFDAISQMVVASVATSNIFFKQPGFAASISPGSQVVVGTVTGATVTPAGAALSLPMDGEVFRVAAGNFGTLYGGYKGRRVTLVFNGASSVFSGTGSVGAMQLQGGSTFNATAQNSVTFVHDGTQFWEIGRATGNGTFDSMTISSTNSTGSLVVVDAGTSGANIKLAGNGSTTPNKYVRAIDGKLSVVNSAYMYEILSLDDAGNLTVAGDLRTLNAVSAKSFGVRGDGTTDDTTALQSFIDYVTAGHSGTIGPGSYLITSPLTINVGSVGWSILGTSSTAVQLLVSPSFSGGMSALKLVGTGASTAFILGGFAVRPVDLGAPSTGTATLGFQIGDPTTAAINVVGYKYSLVTDVNVFGFAKLYQVSHTRLLKFDSCAGWNQPFSGANTCLEILQNGSFTGDLIFSDCQFVTTNVSGNRAVAFTSPVGPYNNSNGNCSISGVKFRSCVFYHAYQNVYVLAQNGSYISDIWFSDGTQFEGLSYQSLYMESNNSGTLIEDVHVEGCYVNASTNAGISLVSTGTGGSLKSVFVQGNFITNHASIALNCYGGGVINPHVSDNEFVDCNNTFGAAIELNGTTSPTVTNNTARTGLLGQRPNYLVQLESTCTSPVVTGNQGPGGVLVGVINDLTGAIQKDVSGNPGYVSSFTSLGAAGSLTLTSTNSTGSLVIADTGTSGANIKLAGNGGTTPNKYVRAIDGKLSVVNSAYMYEIASLTDAGDLVTAGAVTSAGAVTGTAFIPTSSAVPSSGLYLAATNVLTLSTNTTERVRIDASGNVGVGCSPSVRLHTRSDSAGATSTPLMIDNGGASGTSVAAVAFANAGNTKSSIAAAVYGNDYMTFNVGSNTERVRIDSSGNLGIGTASPVSPLSVALGASFGAGSAWSSKTAVFGAGSGSTSGNFGIAFDTTNGTLLMSVAPATSWYPIGYLGSTHTFSVGSAPAVTIDANKNLAVKGAVADQSYSKQSPTTGFTVTIGNNVQTLILTPAGTLLTGTVTMPSTPIDGQLVYICSTQQITTLTVLANTGQSLGDTFATTLAAGGGLSYIYVTGTTTWYRRQ